MTKENFDAEIKTGVTFVCFHEPSSEDYKALAPIWEQFAQKMKSVQGVKIGAINAGPNTVIFLLKILILCTTIDIS